VTLSPAQSRVYHALRRLSDDTGFPPTIQEVARAANVSLGYTYTTLRLLAAEGWIRSRGGKYLPIDLTGDEK
jgi:DNA-binding IscR family transcriptional regulator